MSNKHKQPADRPRVDPLGDLKIAEARGMHQKILADNIHNTNLGFLEQIKKETSETIVKIRSNTDAAENQRRMQEERTKKER